MPHKNPGQAKEYERQRYHRRSAERLAQGLCPKCGKESPEPGRSLCIPCAEKKRKAARARYAKGKAEGKLYGGRNGVTRRRNARARDRRRRQAWREAGLCTRCGKHPGGEGGSVCAPCKETRRLTERQLYAARRAAGLCGRCGHPAFNGTARCGPCSAVEAEYNPIRNEAGRRRYAQLRARGLCTDCGQLSHGAARCEDCARRSYVRSGHFRGIPVWDPNFTVIEIATGEDHGTFDSEAEVLACMAFAKLSREEVEIIADVSVMASLTG